MACDHILVIGMMGCGKTTVGRALGARLGIAHYDTDRVVEQSEGVTIAEIFESRGESEFRKLEFQALKSTIVAGVRAVISTGGGTMCSDLAWSVVPRGVLTVWLDATPAVLVERVRGSTSRPLLAEGGSQALLLERLLHNRRPFYERAELRCDASLAIDQIVDGIVTYERDRP